MVELNSMGSIMPQGTTVEVEKEFILSSDFRGSYHFEVGWKNWIKREVLNSDYVVTIWEWYDNEKKKLIEKTIPQKWMYTANLYY